MDKKTIEIIIENAVRDALNEAGPLYTNSATPYYGDTLKHLGKNPLAVDHGNHGGVLDGTPTPSTVDWNGANFGANEVIPLSNNGLVIYKIKNFGSDNIDSSLSFFGKGAKGEVEFRKAIDTLYGAARRNGKNVIFRTIVSAENPPKPNSFVKTFWEYSFDNGNTWYIMKPRPTQTMTPSKLVRKQ